MATPIHAPDPARDAFRDGRLRQNTAAILGAICCEAGLADAAKPTANNLRSKEWLTALEKADFIPTMSMVRQLDGALKFADVDLDVDLVATTLEVEARPLGPKARQLREHYGLGGAPLEPQHDEPEIGKGLDPLATSVRARDRLLLTSPIMRGGSLLLLQIAVAALLLDVASSVKGPALLALPALFGLALVLTLPATERRVANVSRLARSDSASQRHDQVTKRRKRAGLPETHPGAWYQSGEAPHLIPRYRADATRESLKADVFERLSIAVAINTLFGLGACAALALATEGQAATIWYAGFTLGLGMLAAFFRSRSHGSQKDLVNLLTAALGLGPDPA